MLFVTLQSVMPLSFDNHKWTSCRRQAGSCVVVVVIAAFAYLGTKGFYFWCICSYRVAEQRSLCKCTDSPAPPLLAYSEYRDTVKDLDQMLRLLSRWIRATS